MLVSVFVTLLAVAAAFLYFGYKHDITLRLYGFLLLFLLGVTMLSTGLEYVTGAVSTEVIVNATHTVTTSVNSAADVGVWQGRVPGFFLAAISALGFALTFFDIREKAGEDD